MEKIHTAKGEVLMEVSPLIDFRSKNSIQSSLKLIDSPLHAQNKSFNYEQRRKCK